MNARFGYSNRARPRGWRLLHAGAALEDSLCPGVEEGRVVT